ncbi:MAG: hypothetical protein CMA00_003715 [Methanobacteriota archaeon]|nr:MAG: hypothetical protein CMA00_003715 [Euryarchaeota archaeon]
MSGYLAQGTMAEDSEKPKVSISPSSTSVTSGTEVQEKLIEAARVFSDLLKPTFGPRGLDKMLYKTDGNTAVTNDGAKIVAELLVKHPAAKMMVSMAESQEEDCGDGVTTTMLLCGSFLIEANNLFRKGIHPLTLVEGYAVSLEACRSQIESDSIQTDESKLSFVVETALSGKIAESAVGSLSPIIVEALNTVEKNRGHASAENVSMFKSRKGSIRDSRLVKGVCLRRRILIEGLPNNIKDARVVCLDGDIKIREMTRDAELKISSADDYEAFLQAENDRKEQISGSIVESGANLVLCSGEIDKDILHLLNDNGILAIGDLDSSELRNCSDATGARILETALDICEENLGICGSVVWERGQDSDEVEDVIRILDCPSPSVVTIEVGGAGEAGTEEVIRGLHDSLRAASLAIREEVLPGAGSIHSRMARAVRESSEAQSGRERLAMEAFARALETIPATLVENAGGESLDRVLELRASSKNDSVLGISSDGKLEEINRIWHPRSVIANSLESAAETAMGMLRIDQVISARGE